MKMMYNGTQIKSLNIKHYEMDTNSATVQPSDLQAGVTCFGRGKKITGTGKSFEHANYGRFMTNFPIIVPSNVNIIEITSTEYPVRHVIALGDMKDIDFNTSQSVANVIINSLECPITASVTDGTLMLQCEQTINVEVFFGKDNYV